MTTPTDRDELLERLRTREAEIADLRTRLAAWEAAQAGQPVRRDTDFTSLSGRELAPVYTALDAAGPLELPGEYPYTRGIHPTMYRGRLWTMRQFAGFGTAEDTNRRYKFLLERGQTGLSVAFDFPTLMGYDGDHPRSEGEVGKCGVAISSLADMETLFDGILHDCAERLRLDPTDFPALVRGVTVYMIVIEGTLALTGARFIIKSLKERGWLPGFVSGFTAVNRDESRHVGFGVKFLADAIKADQANAVIVQDTLKECLPITPLVFAPSWVDDPYSFETPFYHSTEVFAYAMKALSKKLAAMGLDPAMLAADPA